MADLANFTLLNSTTKSASVSAHGPVKFDKITFTGPSSYHNTGATIGETGLAAGLGGLKKATVTPLMLIAEAPVTGYVMQYDPDTDLLRFFSGTTAFAEVANTVDLSAVTFRALVISY